MTSPYAAGMGVLTAEAERRMVDRCSVTRPGAVQQTPELGSDLNPLPSPAAAPVYEGPCTVSDPSSAFQRNQSASDEAGVPNQRAVRVPHRAALEPGDLVTVTSSAFSPGLVGSTFVVLNEEERSYASYRRYIVRGSSWLSTAPPG